MNLKHSVAELQKEHVVMELECIDSDVSERLRP
jgi:hypothetical protein